MDTLVKKYQECSVYRIASDSSLYQMIEFVVNTNSERYSMSLTDHDKSAQVKEIYSFEKAHLKNMFFYKAVDPQGNLIGTIRVLKCKADKDYPLTPAFKPDLFKGKQLWHVGRFAVNHSTNTLINAISFKRLVLYALAHICDNVGSILIAECDKRLFTTLNHMKINLRKTGNSFTCLGSETIPVMASYSDIYPFFDREKFRI